MAAGLTIGVIFYSWNGRPALESQDGRLRYIASPGTGWIGATDETATTGATLRAHAITIGRDEFDDRFSGVPWNVPDLDGWFQRRDPARPFDSYRRMCFWVGN
ncbi:hypothetical protein [Sphingobium estronivorans]|uniref:hypothetical protein n=1 Tax=Sphingobium estronivorans TaxID=1577690 RepID=UPI0013C3437E|nr:hypothetical protein [Sphingobium estronivorans]